jgi:predicted Zn-dependent peptidase
MAQLTTDYPKLQFSDERLKNGLRLIMSEDHLVPVVGVNLWYNVGSRNELSGKTGLAHLFEHMMFEGSAHVKKSEHFKLINSIGGSNNASTNTNRTNYFEWAPSHHLETLLWLEADRMGGLLEALNQKTLDNQRDVVKNERREIIDNVPYGSWIEKAHTLLFPEGHPYHHFVIGSMDDLSAASLKDVKDFFSSYYTPSNCVLTIVGDFDPTQARKWVDKYFSKIPANAKIPPLADVELPLTLGGEVRETIRDRVPYPGVFAFYRSHGVETREYEVMRMAGAVLALGRGSRMYQRLVREKIALQADFFTIPQPGVSITGALAICFPGLLEEAVEKELMNVVDSIKTERVTPQELARARAQVERSIVNNLTTVAARADWLSEHATLFGDPGEANEQLDKLMTVTAEEIRAVATEVLTKENRAVITFVRKPAEPKKTRRR